MTETASRNQILAAATAVFAAKGFAGASMNDIVATAGMSKGGVYWHFKSKDEIVAAIFAQFFDEQKQILEAVLAGEGGPSEKLTRLTHLISRDMQTIVAQFPASLEFYTLAVRNEFLRQQLQAFYSDYSHRLRLLAEEAVAAGDWMPAPAADIAHTLIALFEGMMLVWTVFPGQFELASQMDTAVQLLLQGLHQRGPHESD